MSLTFVEPDFSNYVVGIPADQPSGRSLPSDVPGLSVSPLSSSSLDSSPRAGFMAPPALSSSLQPPKSPFLRRVSFDTISFNAAPAPTSPIEAFFVLDAPEKPAPLANPRDDISDRDMASFVVSSRHQDHHPTRFSRTFLFSMTAKEYSLESLRWLMSTMLADGDELVCLAMYQPDEPLDETPESAHQTIYQRHAEAVLKTVLSVIESDLKINIVVELGIGAVKAMALKTLVLYQPSVVVVGTSEKSFSHFARMRYKKTVSSYLIARSPVPVIIVSPQTMPSVQDPARKHPWATSTIAEELEDDPEPFSVTPQTTSSGSATARGSTGSGSALTVPAGAGGSDASRHNSTTSCDAEPLWPKGSFAYYSIVSDAVKSGPLIGASKAAPAARTLPEVTFASLLGINQRKTSSSSSDARARDNALSRRRSADDSARVPALQGEARLSPSISSPTAASREASPARAADAARRSSLARQTMKWTAKLLTPKGYRRGS